MSQIIVYMNFNGNCREAMKFYQECLGGELILNTVGESPMASQMPAGEKDKILHSQLENKGIILMGSDMMGPGGFFEGNTVSLMLDCSSEEEINRYFSALSSGGKINMPLEKTFWAERFGAFTDKFGKSWMLNYGMEGKEQAVTETAAHMH